METAAGMALKEEFTTKAQPSEFDFSNAAPIPLERLAYASTTLNNNKLWAKANASKLKREKDKEKEDETEDHAQLALESIRQAYEQFQNQYAKIAFYDDADERLNRLEGRINDQINDLDNQTELLTGQNGGAVYQDQENNFYLLKQDQRIQITEEDEIDSLKEKVQTIENAGKTVRSEDQQNDYLYLSNLLTDKMNLDADMSARRAEAKDLNAEVEKDHSKAPEATETMTQEREEIERRINELETRFDTLSENRNQVDQTLDADKAEIRATVDSDLEDMISKRSSLPPSFG